MKPLNETTILTISQLNKLAHSILENTFQTIWVEGEISNILCAKSKHWYFSLKDEHAQVRAVMFQSTGRKLSFMPENGMRIIARATVGLYQNRGDFQLIVEQLEEIGFGALQRAFEQLKSKLQQEGLFDETHKKTLPPFPKQIGVITSPTGAAIRDVLTVLKRRFPIANVILYPSLVQGAEAARQIVNAIQIANKRNECDVLLLCRGGGSIEDLWSFNEEIVARAIFNSQIPLISGVGHEIDFTVADFVADRRAPTPSAAAELITPDQQKLLCRIKEDKRLLFQGISKKIGQKNVYCNNIKERLKRSSPIYQLQQQTQRLDRSEHALFFLQEQILERKKLYLARLSGALEAISPLATLKRGYSVLSTLKGQIIRTGKDAQKGDKIKARLSEGELYCNVEEIY